MSDDCLPISMLAQSRAQIYDAFADFFTGKSSERFANNWAEIVRFINGIETLCERPQTQLPTQLPSFLDLDRYYAKLFLGVGVRTVPLVASAYTNEHHMMCQEDWRSLNDLYQSHGFTPSEEWTSFADSVAVELAFLALLARTQSSPTMQTDFLTSRLIPLVYSVRHEVKFLDGGPIEEVLNALLSLLDTDKELLAQSV